MQNKPIKRTALVAALMIEVANVQAAVIDVDNNTCTLAGAITAANTDLASGGCTAGSGDDVINLPIESTISLTEELPNITNNVTINANNSIIERDANSSAFTVMTVNNLANLTLNDATVRGGLEEDNYGAGIVVFDANINLNNSVITENEGGALLIVRGNDSTLNNVHVTNNISASSGNYYSAGVSISAGNVTIENSTIDNNVSTSGKGAGIYATNFAGQLDLTVINSTISSNITNSNGAGIYHYDYLQLSTSNINIINTTITANQSIANGAGINNDEANFTINQSIIAGNTSGDGASEINSTGGSFTLNDYNLIGLNGNSGSTGITLGVTDTIPSEANLSDIIDTALSNNGGTTPTHNLVTGSPAIDAITGACAQATDQAGNSRPNDGDGDTTAACDIGAIEFQLVDDDLIFANGFETPND